MNRRGVEITVGLFILMGILSLMVLALRVSGLSDIYSGQEGAVVTVDFERVGGLKPRARVTIGGVQVGRVTSIKLSQEAMDGNVRYIPRVTMILNHAVTNLSADTRAQILTSGLLGDNFIELEPGLFEEGEEKSLLVETGRIPLENTIAPISLEEIVSKFVSSKASGLE